MSDFYYHNNLQVNTLQQISTQMKILLAIVFCIIFSNFVLAQHKEFKWLIGKWKLENKNEFEVWTLNDASGDLIGKAFRVDGADTTITEAVSITYWDKGFHYIPDVAGEQQAIDFRITSIDERSFVAENPEHDFPKLIRYKLVQMNDGEFIEAAIEGNGKVIPYRFQRLK